LFYFILGCSFLRAKSYNTAIHYINLLLNLPDAESVQDLYRFTRIIQLVIHFELGNFRLIESLSQSTQRLLKNEKKLFGIEVVMLELFVTIAHKNGEDKDNELLNTAYKKMKEQLKDPFEQRTLAYFNFVDWFEEKLHKKDILIADKISDFLRRSYWPLARLRIEDLCKITQNPITLLEAIRASNQNRYFYS
jgi:hypothetical protein